MTNSRSERLHKSEAARLKRRTLKNIVWTRTQRLYSRLRKQRKKD